VTKCIYCQAKRSKESFKRTEHVLPQSFGMFRHNLTLHGVVCDLCNQYFGDNLELPLARDTFEGQLRFKHGVKNPEQFKSAGRKSRIVVRSIEGDFAGCYMCQEYVEEMRVIAWILIPQVGFLLAPDNKYEYFLLDDIPTKAELDNRGYQARHPRSIVGLKVGSEEITELLRVKGFSFRYMGPVVSNEQLDTIVCNVTGTIDHVIFRAIAKIAFNYLAYWEGTDFVQHPDFHKAREYIRWGHVPVDALIRSDETAILQDDPREGPRTLGHLITVGPALYGRSILAQVSLFNWRRYLVHLARDFTGPRLRHGRGHLFNVADRHILTLKVFPRFSGLSLAAIRRRSAD
jgi:hypothetical protein